jgi:hypothetical protein
MDSALLARESVPALWGFLSGIGRIGLQARFWLLTPRPSFPPDEIVFPPVGPII